MRIDELKSPYRELAEMRRAKQPSSTCDETFGFGWGDSKEGHDWWWRVWGCEYPEIPQSSLHELKEYQNQFNETIDDKLFTAAVAAMQGIVESNDKDVRNYMEYHKTNFEETVSLFAWKMAEALIKEGKERGHL